MLLEMQRNGKENKQNGKRKSRTRIEPIDGAYFKVRRRIELP